MARRVRDAQLETRSSRAKLRSRLKPYYRLIEKGLHLGYRRLSGRPGTWSIRYYLGEQKYSLEKIGDADDSSDADGIAILNFWQAQDKARERFAARAKAAAGVLGPLLIADIVKVYVARRDTRETQRRGRKIHSDAWRLLPYVVGREKRGRRDALPASSLATKILQDLCEADLLGWQQELPSQLKATSKRRVINDLKAALNSAFEANHRQLEPSLLTAIRRGLRMVSDEPLQVARENQILGDGQVTTILAAAYDIDTEHEWDGDLGRFVTVLAATGARFSQVARMRVMDVQREAGRLLVPTSRKGKGRKQDSVTVPIGRDVLDALLPAVTGRPPHAPLLTRWRHEQDVGGMVWHRKERGPWQSASELTRPWAAIRKALGMADVIPYALRHSSIVRGIKAGLPIRLVAAMHDTSVPMIERHYSRWIVDGLEELAARAVVPLLPKDEENILAIRRA